MSKIQSITSTLQAYPDLQVLRNQPKPSGWVEIQRKSNACRWAIDDNREKYSIITVQYLVTSTSRFGRGYGAYKYYYLAHPSIFLKIEKDYKKSLEKFEKENPEKVAAAAAARKQKLANAKAHRAEASQVLASKGLLYNKYTDLLYTYLDDITAADEGWLKEAEEALTYSLQNGRIMAEWKKGEDNDFYDCLKKAINGHRRHNDTDYDQLLASGISRDTARELIYHN